MTLRILAIDTCTEACSAALLQGDELISRHFIAPREHAQLLLPTVQALLAEGELSLSQLNAIEFARGPGSFTGVRISTATAQGLAFGAELPVLAMSTLQALALQGYRLSGITTQLAAIDARMNEIYCGVFKRQEQDMIWVGEEQVCAPEHWLTQLQLEQPYYGTGSGWLAYGAQLNTAERNIHPEDLYPLAEDMAYLSQFAWQRGEAVAAELAQPVYLRDTVPWKKLPGRE